MNLASMLQERSPLRDRSETRTVHWWTSLVWPVTGLALLLLFNLAFTEGFFRVEIRDGRLYGVLVDILNHGSKVMLLSLGMALVIATGGVDLSVGAVMAITGAVAAQLINTEGIPFPVVIVVSLCVALVAGAWNGLLVGAFNVQPIVATLILMVAGRGVAQLITGGQIITFTDPLLTYVGNGSLFGLPFPVLLSLAMLAVTILYYAQDCHRPVHRNGRRQSTRQLLRRCQRCEREILRLCLFRFLCRPSGIGGCVEHQVRGCKSCGPFPGVGRNPCRGRRRNGAHGWPILPGWCTCRCSFHSNAHYDDVHAQCQCRCRSGP